MCIIIIITVLDKYNYTCVYIYIFFPFFLLPIYSEFRVKCGMFLTGFVRFIPFIGFCNLFLIFCAKLYHISNYYSHMQAYLYDFSLFFDANI